MDAELGRATLTRRLDAYGRVAIHEPANATAEVFLTAFEALPRSQREVVLQHLFANPALKEDLIDVARWYERRAERSVSYEKIRQMLRKVGL